MNDKYAELKHGLRINLQSLHIDAQTQAERATEAGEMAAEAKATARRKKLELDEARASADMEVRSMPGKYGLEKVTESAVASAVIKHPAVMKLGLEAIDAEELANKADALFTGYHHRKGMLEAEIDLYKSNYWGDVQERRMVNVGDDSKMEKADHVERRRRETTC